MSAALSEVLVSMRDRESEERRELEATLGARSFAWFVRMAWPYFDTAKLRWNWHAQLICDEMQAAAARETTELVVCIPPRSMKSSIIGVAFPAWVWTWFPGAKFISASYEMTLATRDAVRTRALVKSDWYQARWGPSSPYRPKQNERGTAISADQDNKTYYETTSHGCRFVCTPTTNVTGWGADFISADDPHPVNKAESEAQRLAVSLWWWEAIPSRLNEPDRGVKMIIQQRTHEHDLAGQAIKRGYHKVVLPALFDPKHPHLHPRDPRKVEGEPLHPDRMSAATVQKLAREMGEYASAGQLQQLPKPRTGGLFKRTKLVVVDHLPSRPVTMVRRWDLASSEPEPGRDPDWTVGVKMARLEDRRYAILDVVRMRGGPDDVRKAIKAVASQDGTMVQILLPQDPGQAGKAQAKDLTLMLAGYPVRAEVETGEKWVRAQPFASQVAMDNVVLLRGEWNEPFIEELTGFPNASHDDQVDAAAGAFIGFFQAGAGMMDFYRELTEQLAAIENEQHADDVARKVVNNAPPAAALPDDDDEERPPPVDDGFRPVVI